MSLAEVVADLGRMIAGAQRLGDDGQGPCLADAGYRGRGDARDYAPRTDLGVVVWCIVAAAVCDGKSRARAPEREVGVFEVGCPACGAFRGGECADNAASRACAARIRVASEATGDLRGTGARRGEQ